MRLTKGRKLSIGIITSLVLLDCLIVPVFGTVDDSNTKLLFHFDTTPTTEESGSIFTEQGTVYCWPLGNHHLGESALLTTGASTGSFIQSTVLDSKYNHSVNDFTFDFWIYMQSATNNPQIYQVWVDGNNREQIWFTGSTNRLNYQYQVGGTVKAQYYCTYAAATHTNNWTHIAIERSGSSCLMFINGISQAVTAGVAFNGNLDMPGSYIVKIGQSQGTGYDYFIDEFRYSNGIARWTSDFTPPTSAYSGPVPISGWNSTEITFYQIDPQGGTISGGTSVTATDLTDSSVLTIGPYHDVAYYLTLNRSRSYSVVGVAPGYYNGTITLTPPLRDFPPYYIYMTKANSNASRAFMNFYVYADPSYTGNQILQKGARITINGQSGYTNQYGFYQFDAEKDTTYTYTVSLQNYLSQSGSFNISADTNRDIYLLAAYPTPTPFPTTIPGNYGTTPITTLDSKTRSDKVQAGADIWYLNADFLSMLFFLAVVMGVMGLIGNSVGGRRRR